VSTHRVAGGAIAVCIAVLACAPLIGCSDAAKLAAAPKAWVKIRTQVVPVAVAATAEQQTQGLSGLDSLEWGTRMLFLYEIGDFQRFWMIDMKFPIDMVWIRDGRIVGIHHRVPVPLPGTPSRKLPRYGIEELVDSVLEVPAGYAASNGWSNGDAVAFGGDAAKRPTAR
jgi:uncharacterized membrane protein (UPF0127 family)